MSVIAIFDTVIHALHASEELKQYVSNDPFVSLTLYGLFRQATDGDCLLNSSNDDAHTSAWKNCAGMSGEAAMREYLNVLGYSLDRLDLAQIQPQLNQYIRGIMVNIHLAREYQSPESNVFDAAETYPSVEPTKTPNRRIVADKPKSVLKDITKKYTRVAVSPVFEKPVLTSEGSNESVETDTPRKPTSNVNQTPHKSITKNAFQNHLDEVELDVMQLVSKVTKTPIRITSNMANATGKSKFNAPTPAKQDKQVLHQVLNSSLGPVSYDEIQLDSHIAKDHPKSIISVLKLKESALLPHLANLYSQVDTLKSQNEQLTHVVERQQRILVEYTQAIAQIAGGTDSQGNTLYNIINALYNKVHIMEKYIQDYFDREFTPLQNPQDSSFVAMLKRFRTSAFHHAGKLAYHLFLVLVALVIIRRYYSTFCTLQDAVNNIINSLFP